MRARTSIVLLAGLNLLLLGILGYHFLNQHRGEKVQLVADASDPARNGVRTNFVVRRLNFTWEEVESADYVTYIKNLREIGCPETTIRDIIVADVDQHYAHRKSEQTVTNDFEWWRSEPNTNELQRISEQVAALDEERRLLLNRLLGPDWDKPDVELAAPIMSGIILAGPVLGELPEEAKRTVYDIAERAKTRRDAYLDAQRQLGLPLSSAEMARMRQEMRSELAQVLNPEQMEEFLLRYSETAEQMRQEFRGLELTPDEFRSIFRFRDPMEQEAALLGQERNPSVEERLRTLRAQVDSEVQRLIGEERHFYYKLTQDPIFRDTQVRAEEAGVSPEVLYPLYQINRETEVERNRIRNDPALSTDQRIEALAQVQADQQMALRRLLGDEGLQRWLQLQERR
jgi:hypothetical protein